MVYGALKVSLIYLFNSTLRLVTQKMISLTLPIGYGVDFCNNKCYSVIRYIHYCNSYHMQ